MSATVGGNVCDSGGNVCNSGGNVRNSGDIEYDLGNLTMEMAIDNCAKITSEGTWNIM